ncbi:MAG: hypothetical protein AAF682_08060 [Planctomycetota bacterium]
MRIPPTLIVLLAAPLLTGCPDDYWERTGPGAGGYFMDIGAGPSGMVVACSDLSGPYRSLDRGASWEPIGPERGITNTHAASVAFHATNPALVYLGSGNGLFRSQDFGQSFVEVIADGYFEYSAIAPSDESIVYTAFHAEYNGCSGEVHRSNDGGDTWQRVDTNLPPDHRILKILVLPSDPNSIYLLTGKSRFIDEELCTLNRNAFLSEDGGVTYTPIGGSFANLVADIALDPHDEEALYLSQDDADSFHLGYLHRSPDRGATWTYLDAFSGFIWPDAEDAQTIRMSQKTQYPWLPKDGIWESTQGGAAGTWVQQSSPETWDSAWTPVYWAFNAGGRSISADPSDPNAVWWAGSQFVFASFDKGLTVQPMFTNEVGGPGSDAWRSRGVDNVVVVDLAINEANPDEIYAGFWDLGTWCSLDGGESWIMRNDFDASGGWQGGGANTFAVETDPARPGVVWATQAGAQTGPALLLRSEDSGATWPVIGAGLPAAPLIGLSLDRASSSTQRTLYITADGDVYASVDDGLNWELRHEDGGLRFTAVDRHDSSIVYAGGENGLWRSTAFGAPETWVEVGLPEMRGTISGLPSAWSWVGVYDIEPDPSVPGRLYVSVHGSGKGLYRSDDNGTTWGPATLLDDDHLRVVAVDPGDSNVVYATSSSALNAGGYSSDSGGVWKSEDAGATWAQQNEGLIWPFASTFAFGPAGSDVAFLGSPGTGIHRRADLTLDADAIGVSATAGGAVTFDLTAGEPHGGQPYLLLASASGTSPGLPVAPGVTLPLNDDVVLGFSLAQANGALFVNTFGVLDASASATCSFQAPPGVLGGLLGQELAFAYLTLAPVDLASLPVRVMITP